MDKKTIAFIKARFPRLFLAIVKNPFLARCVSELDRGRYVYCLLAKRPYFGTVALAGQTWEARKSYMRKAVVHEIQTPKKSYFNLLEIGSWAGDSAILWAKAIKGQGISGEVTCVDPWDEPYTDTGHGRVNAATVVMNRAIANGRIVRLFHHNIKTSGVADMIRPIKGRSDQVLPTLEQSSFDMIYIDGDHRYSGLSYDLKESARLLKEGGIICGDDLCLTIDQVDIDHTLQNKEMNIILDRQTKKPYHPGVTLALADFFKSKVSAYNGFWIMRKIKGGWEQVKL